MTRVNIEKETLLELKKHAEKLSKCSIVDLYNNFNNVLFAVNRLSEQAGLTVPNLKFVWPMVGRISANYREQRRNSDGLPYYHQGIDIADNPLNKTPIKAVDNGIVTYAQENGGYGLVIDIKHNYNVITRYAHCSKLLVKTGDAVKQGQQIAIVGSTGHSTGPHLHFEVHKDGKLQDPLQYLPKRT